MMFLHLYFVVASFAFSVSDNPSNFLEVVQVSNEVQYAFQRAWTIKNNFPSRELPIQIVKHWESAIFKKLRTIHSKIETLAAKIDGTGTHTILTVQKLVPKLAYAKNKTLDGLTDFIKRINVVYTKMGEYIINNNSTEKANVDYFVRAVLWKNESCSILNLLETFHTFVIGTNSVLFNATKLEVKGNNTFCNMNESWQQLLLNIYNTIALTELKGYSMIQFSYMLLNLYGGGNFTKEADINKKNYEEQSRTTLKSFRGVITGASREIWKCDPMKHIKGESYLEITELLQGYIENEIDLNPKKTCEGSCAHYTSTKRYSCFDNLYCSQQRHCNGKIINCKFINSVALVCPAALGTNRRYEYIEYENGPVLGRNQSCYHKEARFNGFKQWFVEDCSYCVCLCDEQGHNSDRYFNMRSSEADINNNRVVTGLRFVKKNRIIHLQIQEGKLQPRAKIDVLTVHWKPVDKYKVTDRDVFNQQDFHTLTWEKRNFDLDDLSVDSNELLTGVRFKMIGSHLNFEIKATPFDFTSGKLVPAKSYWKDNANTDVSKTSPRRKLNLDKRDIPIKATEPSYPDSKSNQYLEFTNTDLYKDAAQTTIPFIDSQPVESLLPVPLNGAGIYHKGSPDFGGFIAPKIITYDYSKLLETAIHDSDFGEEIVQKN